MGHANAPLTRTGRLRLVGLVEDDGLTFAAAAAAANVAPSTVHCWVGRWRAASDQERRTLACLEEGCEELIDAGEHVISVVTGRARGAGNRPGRRVSSGGGLDDPRGQIVRVVWFSSREEAREAVRLRE